MLISDFPSPPLPFPAPGKCDPVGDIRSRLVRLIVTDSDESKAVERLLTFRLDKEDPDKAKRDWYFFSPRAMRV